MLLPEVATLLACISSIMAPYHADSALIPRKKLENVSLRPDHSMHFAVSSHCNLFHYLCYYQPEKAHMSIFMHLLYKYTHRIFLYSFAVYSKCVVYSAIFEA